MPLDVLSHLHRRPRRFGVLLAVLFLSLFATSARGPTAAGVRGPRPAHIAGDRAALADLHPALGNSTFSPNRAAACCGSSGSGSGSGSAAPCIFEYSLAHCAMQNTLVIHRRRSSAIYTSVHTIVLSTHCVRLTSVHTRVHPSVPYASGTSTHRGVRGGYAAGAMYHRAPAAGGGRLIVGHQNPKSRGVLFSRFTNYELRFITSVYTMSRRG
jgi:hypothetical protein